MMAKKKKSMNETADTVFAEESAPIVEAVEEKQVSQDLATRLSKMCEQPGVLGFILRDTTTATINLKEPEKIVDYALLTSQTLESSQEISQMFNLGDFESTLIEGKNMKTLCFVLDENRVNIFMEKDVDHADILNSVRQ
jgi:predicted regulator of Ras-like GTPase activity (Roadblock/LC7/MglB family)